MEKRYLSADIKANTYKTTNKRSGVWWFTNLCKKHLKNLKYNLAKQGVHFSVRQTIPNDVSPSFYVSICQSTYIKWVKNAKLIRLLNWLFSWGFGKEFFFTKFERRRKQRNSSFKKKKSFKTQVIYIILKFKTHKKWRSVHNVKPVMSPGVLAEIIILMPENKNTKILKAIIMLTLL